MREDLAFNPAIERVRGGNEQTSSSEPKVRARTDVKSSTSLEARPATRATIPCAWGAKCQISSRDFGLTPCVGVTSLKADAVYGSTVAYFDMLMVRRSPASGRRKRVLKEQLRF